MQIFFSIWANAQKEKKHLTESMAMETTSRIIANGLIEKNKQKTDLTEEAHQIAQGTIKDVTFDLAIYNPDGVRKIVSHT